MNNKRGSVYKQLLLLFAAIVLPYIIIGTYTLFSSSSKLHRETLNSELSVTRKTIAQLNAAIDNIYKTNFLLFTQSNMLKLSDRSANLSVYEKSVEVNTLREQLSTITSSDILTQYLRIYFEDMGRVYNSSGYPGGSFQDFTDAEYQSLVEQIKSNKIYKYENGVLSILITNTPLGHPSSIIEVIISSHALKEQLSNLTTGTNDYYLLNAAEGTFQLCDLPDNIKAQALDLLNVPHKKPLEKIRLNGTSYFLFYDELPGIDGQFIRLISTKTLLAHVQILNIYTIAFLIMTFIGYIAFFVITRRLIRTPLSELVAGLGEVEKGNYSIQIRYNTRNDFSYLYYGFNQMAMNINNSIERDYKMKLLLQQAELKQLQAQINPHFLYNSFFMLQRIIQSGLQEEAIEVTELLGKYFNYITKNANDLVSLKEEYEHALIYSQIQEMRFEGRIKVDFEELPMEYSSLLIPKLILQPVLENSYKYALDSKLSNGLLRIKFFSQYDMLKIYIEDNGEGLSDESLALLKENLIKAESGNSMEMNGLFNICRRLTIFFQNRGNLQVERSSLGGLAVCITLLQEDNLNE